MVMLLKNTGIRKAALPYRILFIRSKQITILNIVLLNNVPAYLLSRHTLY